MVVGLVVVGVVTWRLGKRKGAGTVWKLVKQRSRSAKTDPGCDSRGSTDCGQKATGPLSGL